MGLPLALIPAGLNVGESIGKWLGSNPFAYKGQSIADFQADVAAGKWLTLIERWRQFPPSDVGGKNRYVEPLTNQFNRIKSNLAEVERWAKTGWPPAQELLQAMSVTPQSNVSRLSGMPSNTSGNIEGGRQVGLIDVNSNNNSGLIVFGLVVAVVLFALKSLRR